MNVTFRQLQVFEAVARHLSYTRAAEEMHLTQPAVSMQIKQLEEQVGLPLFEQLGKKVYLTEAGREMRHYAKAMVQLLADAEGVLEAMKGIQKGSLDISVTTTANYCATRLLAAFSQRFRSVTYRLDVTNREAVIRQLTENEKDLVIMGRPPGGLDLVAESFMENPLVVIARPDHPMAKRQHIALSELQGEPFVIREQGSGTRMAMERFFQERNVTLSAGIELSSNEAIKQAVQAGLGLGIVSTQTLELELEAARLCILDVDTFPIMRHWYLVYRKGKRLSPVATAFRQFVLDEAEPLQPAGGG